MYSDAHRNIHKLIRTPGPEGKSVYCIIGDNEGPRVCLDK
jgi:hypothetical protein